MRTLWLLTIKNIKLLLRAKGSALIVVFAPLIIILLLGLSFDTTDAFRLQVGVYASSLTDDVNSFTQLLKEDSALTVTEYSSSIDECTTDIKRGKIHACISLPTNLQVEGNTQKEVVFYVDPSRVNLVGTIQDAVQDKFTIKVQEISESLTQNILTTLSNAQNSISETQPNLASIKDKTSSAAGALGSTQESLTTIDVAAPQTIHDIAGPISTIDAEVKSAKSKVNSAIDLIQATELDEETKSSLTSPLTAAKKELATVSTSLVGGANDTGTNLDQLVGELQADLVLTRSKLTSASSAISSSSASLAPIKTSLEETNALVDSIDSSLSQIASQLGSSKVTDSGTIAAPLTSRIETVGQEGTYLNYLFPAILVLVVMFGSLLLGTTLVMMERHSPAFLRNFFLPIRKVTFITSIYLTNTILSFVQIFIILGISLFFLQDSLPQFPWVFLILFITSSVFIFIGMTIGYIFSSEETGALATISLGSILLFLSGIILPLEGVSQEIQQALQFNPFVVAENLIREVFLFSVPLAELTNELLILISYAVVFFFIILFIENVLHKTLRHKFLHQHHKKHRRKDKLKRTAEKQR